MNKLVFFLVLLCLAVAAQVIPLPPSADPSQPGMVMDCEQDIRPLNGTPSAKWHPDEGYLELPLKFQQPGLLRLGWDIPFSADLTNAYGVEFDLYVSESDALDQSNQFIYFHSGDGWYRCSFSLCHPGRWNHVVLNKSLAESENQPGGWGKVDGVRVSFGCFEDPDGAVSAIANFRPCQRHGEVLIVSAVSYGLANPGSTGYKHYTEKAVQTMDELEIGCMSVADTEVSAEMLKGVRIVILPNNPQVPENLAGLLTEFVANGGKLIAAYKIPEEMTALLGVRITGWKHCDEGNFKGFLATSDALPHQPALARQDSSNTNLARLIGEGRIFANWATSDGSDSGVPAALETPVGIYLSHVWQESVGQDAKSFFLAMLAELAPEVLRKSAEETFAEIGVLMDYDGLDDIRRRFPSDASAEAAAALDRAFDMRSQAQKCLDSQKWFECRELCAKAQEHAVEALCRLALPGPADEQRAFWCHSAFGLPNKNWDESIKLLAENGFNAILGNFLWAGVAFYPSEVLPAYSELAMRGDQLRQCLDACKKYGVKCHVWAVAWNLGWLRDKEFARRLNDEHRTQVSYSGKPEPEWLCPSNPENFQMISDAMLEVVRNYPDVAGLHFDYIRYPGNEHCFCDTCRRKFEERIGHPVENWPADVRKEALQTEWRQFRCDQISALVKFVHDEAKKMNPAIEISAAVFKNYKLVRENNGQDWETWCREGWLDFVCPMDYTDSLATFRGFIRRQLEWAHGVRLCPGLGLSLWKHSSRPLTMIEQISTIRHSNLPGFTVFNFDQYAQEVLPLLRLGCTRH